MTVEEATSEETPYGRYVTSAGWFVLNLEEALAVRNEEKGGASYPIEPRESPFPDVGVHVRVLWPGDPSALYHSEAAQEGFLVLSGTCTLVVEEEERSLRQWDYFHCPAGTRHVIVGAGDGPCAILMLGSRPESRPCATRRATWRRRTAPRSRRTPTSRTRRTPTGRATTSPSVLPGRSAEPAAEEESRQGCGRSQTPNAGHGVPPRC